ncbi:MAG: FAD-dependent oxidoreductase [Gammaproteobacteria bacterium]|nr:FAD-dependent oxidoreductase [Gammaproteobacteria bacterium]MBU2435621.1 FAD-dependent oxidoreductase [Gammaproteobacteria bacterium]MBU2449598.1 FAD-dependent oxidoreductase [Gammaproteobacteria bacterium]
MKHLVLAGGGHAHLHVLKALAACPWPGVEVTLISPYARQIYSGMLPGWMAGHYRLDQCAAALEPLLKAAKVRFIQDSVSGLDARRRIVQTQHSGDIAYDDLSLDTGAQVDASCLAATGAKLLAIRPIESFVVDWTQQVDRFKQNGKASLAVVGGGAAGVELALAARYRLSLEMGANKVQVILIAGSGLLPGHGSSIVRRVAHTLARRQIEVVQGYAAGCSSGLQLSDGTTIPVDCVIAATGVKPAAWLADSRLALAPDGFIAVQDGQQSVSHPEVFAAGDVASRIDAPHAKSGVYAVRAGPVLAGNLHRVLNGLAPLAYQPQKRSLYLLATGPKEAIMSWGGLSAGGGWAWKWKDWIDRRFMRQYDLAPENGMGEEHEPA